jgi:hypothetical protein
MDGFHTSNVPFRENAADLVFTKCISSGKLSSLIRQNHSRTLSQFQFKWVIKKASILSVTLLTKLIG